MLRSVAVSMGLLDTRYVVLLGHTRCGLTDITDDEIRARIGEVTGASRDDLDAIDFLATDALEDRIRLDCERLLASPLLPHDAEVAGAIFDVDTGLVQVIAEPRPRGG
jgi:carbonic anhydrase